jgi:hypothetical protein
MDVDAREIVFLLSPARVSTERAKRLTAGLGPLPLATQLNAWPGVPLGDVFAFLSSLYFRGKLAYANAFARPPESVPGVLVITPGEGLWQASRYVTAEDMRAFANVEVHHENHSFAGPLLRDAEALRVSSSERTQFVLLGSIASEKYLSPLQRAFGERLLFPAEFVGRGDMSRGGLLLRSASDRSELEYIPVAGATLRGKRPARLPPLPRKS